MPYLVRRAFGAITVVASLLLAASAARAQDNSGMVAVFGVGQLSNWTTEISVSSGLDEASAIGWSISPGLICPPLDNCHMIVNLPPRGSVVLPAPPDSAGFLGVGYVTTSSVSAPSVQARAHEMTGSRSVDLPVYRVATLLALNPSVLSFPGATRTATQRCNLLIASVEDPIGGGGAALDAGVSVLNGDGSQVAQRVFHLEKGETAFIPDVIAALGVPDLVAGQIIVTKIGGDGTLWGIMPVSRSDGSLSISTGLVP